MVLVWAGPEVGLKVTLMETLPLRDTFTFREAVPAFLTVLEALPTTFLPTLAVALSLPLPDTFTLTLTPPARVADRTLTDSAFGAPGLVPAPVLPPLPVLLPPDAGRAGGTSAGPQ